MKTWHRLGICAGAAMLLGVACKPGTPAAYELVFISSATSAPSDACTAFNLQIQDGDGRARATGATTSVILQASSNTGKFYADAGCSQRTDTGSIAEGSTDLALYFKDSSVGTDHLTATDRSASLGAAKFALNLTKGN